MGAASESKNQILSIFGYTDYRLYLKDFYAFRKDSHHGYSYRNFSKQGGFSSPNILKLVIEGQRNLTPSSTENFIKALHLEGSMANYFRHLVQFNQAKTDHDKNLHYEQMKRLTPLTKKRELNADTVEYLSHWLHPVIREMAETSSFHLDPYWIARRLTGRATAGEIKKAIDFLLNNGFIEQGENGRFYAKDKMVLSSDEVKNMAIRQYHRKMLEQTKEALDDLEMEDREFGALTFTLPEQSFDELKYKIKQFRKELHLWAIQTASDARSDAVIQVNIQMYPQTKRNRK